MLPAVTKIKDMKLKGDFFDGLSAELLDEWLNYCMVADFNGSGTSYSDNSEDSSIEHTL